MKRPPKSKADRSCLWCYLLSFVWPLVVGILVDLAELPDLVFMLLMVPGGIIGLHGWGLMQELAERPAEKRPSYYGFLDHFRIRDYPILYLFMLLCLFLTCW